MRVLEQGQKQQRRLKQDNGREFGDFIALCPGINIRPASMGSLDLYIWC